MKISRQWHTVTVHKWCRT